MIKSMTGYGRGEYTDDKRSVVAEIKTVNHRYTDISVRLPRRYAFAEDKIKNVIKQTVRRGKADISIIIDNITEDDMNVKLNTMIAKQYFDNLLELKEVFHLEDQIRLEFIAGLPDVMKAVADIEDEEKITQAILQAVYAACSNLDEMRIAEGAKLAEDLVMRGSLINGLASQLAEKAPQISEVYMLKLRERIQELIGNSVELPEDRILVEAAIFADKCNVTEELVRLGSHTEQLKQIISKSNQPDGKKLDFLVQEMNREANTIGSKANDIGMTNIVIEMKAEIEKIREQVQNIE